MKLVENADKIFKYGWSIRWIVISAFCSFLEAFLNLFAYNVNEPGYVDFFIWQIPIGSFAALAALSSTMAFITRFIAQEKVSGKQT